MSLRPAAEVAREWLGAQFRSMPSVLRDEDHASLTALVESIRAEALQAAADVARRFDPALDPGILPLRILGLQRAGQ